MSPFSHRPSDTALHHAVRNELDFAPDIDAARIGVVVNQGIVTLVGTARSAEDKERVASVALRVWGVRALVNHLAIDADGITRWSDEAIALNAAEWLTQTLGGQAGLVTIVVESGRITLGGTVETDALKSQVEKEVAKLAGVGAVTNMIEIAGAARIEEVINQIKAALVPLGVLSVNAISVNVEHGNVTLGGRVNSWHAREEAERAARRCPGVHNVDNRLFVDW